MFSGKWRRRLCAAGLMLASAGSLASAQEASPIPARFINAETGAEVPAAITLSSRISPAGGPVRLRSGLDGGKSLSGPAGHHSVEIRAAGYHAMTAPVELGVEPVLPLVFRLQPEQPPSMARPESILARVRPDAALVQGFVTDSDSGALLAGVRVQVVPSGVETASDARGYFELFVPVPPGPEQPGLSLRFSSPGYRSEMRRQVELWPNGDWTYRIRLSRGTGEKMVEERETRRWSGARAGSHAGADGASAKSRLLIPEEPLVAPASTLPSNATARVPRTIRILHNNVVQYETIENYCRFSLPSEWIPSWGAYPGGSNSLQAGAVAVRTYAIGFVNQPLAATYDICATTACQVYNPDISNSRTDQAVSQTAGFVMVNSSGHIPRALTEYSSENNQLNSPCGDGFTAPSAECRADPVCAGEPEFGHGRGMCQWGSAKWATGLKFPGNNFSNPTLMNGQPRRDWAWILEHYYPGLVLVRGAPLMIGDSVRSTASANVRACPGDTIINGVNCPAIGTASAGATGVIASGPIQVFADGSGYTWWNVQWSSGVTGWVVENYLARSIPLPSTPLALAASPLSTSRIRLTWVDPSDAESGFKIEQALSSDGLWTEIAATGMNATSHVITNLNARTAYLFRIRAFNLGGHSPYSAVASATTPGDAIALRNIPDQFVDEEATLAFTAAVTGHEIVQKLADFEAFTTPAANGVDGGVNM